MDKDERSPRAAHEADLRRQARALAPAYDYIRALIAQWDVEDRGRECRCDPPGSGEEFCTRHCLRREDQAS